MLRDCLGWDAWNVTEDIDLGLRLARAGFRTGTITASTDEEAPASLPAWMRQRRRWFKGWLQTMLVHMRHPRESLADLGWLKSLVVICHVGGAVAGTMLGPLFAAITIWHALWGDLLDPRGGLQLLASTVWCFIFTAGLAAAFWPLWLAVRRRSLRSYSGWIWLMPFYWLLQTVAAWWALADLLRNPFHWLKTEHGLARTSRRAQKDPLRRLVQSGDYDSASGPSRLPSSASALST